MLSEEIFSPTRLPFQYMNVLTNSEKLRYFIAPKIIDLITFIDKNVNLQSIQEDTFMVSTVI